jgi:transposase-like protein
MLAGGHWKCLYRAVDRVGETVDFLLTAKRDVAAARRFLERAIDLNGLPDKITIDNSGANTAAIQSIQLDCGVDIELRRIKYLNNIVEHDHRAIKRIVRPMMGSKSLWSASSILAGIETKHMIRKGQIDSADGQPTSDADSFYSLAY